MQPLQTYAVLDAAKAVNLPEQLSASRLEHRCLFMGAAYDEMKNVAPWIVRLEDGNDFTRRLFTGPEGINGLWDKKPGIYMRSRATLDEMWRHLRKFTRVQDNGGNWHYFRFWEAWAFRSYMEHNRNICEQFSRWCIVRPCGVPVYFLTLTDDGVFTTFEAPEHLTYEPRNSRISLNRLDIEVLRTGAASGFDQRLEEYLMREVPAFGELEGAMRKGQVSSLIAQAARWGITIEAAIGRFAKASLVLNQPLDRDPTMLRILGSQMHQNDKSKRLLQAVEYSSINYRKL